MTEFLALLSAYYICDAAAEVRMLRPDEVMTCTGVYEEVKARFLDEAPADPGTRARAAQMRAAYRDWRSWTAENADLVDRLRAEAHAAVARGAAPGG